MPASPDEPERQLDIHDVLARIDSRLDKVHLSQRGAALAADLSADFIRSARRQAATGKQTTMRPYNLSMLAVPLRCNPEWLMYGIGPEEATEFGKTVIAPAAVRERARLTTSIMPALPIRGAVAADVWVGPDHVGIDHDLVQPPAPDPTFPAKDQFALIVRDTSINRIAQYGDFLLILDRHATAFGQPTVNALVVVSYTKDHLRETTVRRIVTVEAGLILKFESTDIRFTRRDQEQPLRLSDEHVTIEGEVIGLYRSLH